MDYQSAEKYMEELSKYGSVLGLESMERLSEGLGRPERRLRIIHLAGTNGKGSVGAFIEAMLRAEGKTVSRYTSPAVFDSLECWSSEGGSITEEEFAAYATRLRSLCEDIVRRGFPHPTRFEVETAIAFLYCADKNTDYSILETGMGGRYDAVNIIDKSAASVITSISRDHMKFLGSTLGEIAYEKAGIIKPGGTVISAPQPKEAEDIIAEVCREKNAALTFAQTPKRNPDGSFDYDDMRNLSTALGGEFQLVNAAVAIEVCSHLGISEQSIRRGLRNAVWHGRFEQICSEPIFIIDGAHNAAAASMLADTLKQRRGEKFNFIIGIFADKEYDDILRITAPLADRIFAVEPDNPRALSRQSLLAAIKKYNKNAESVTVSTAVRECMSDPSRTTVAFGSLSYLKAVREGVTAWKDVIGFFEPKNTAEPLL